VLIINYFPCSRRLRFRYARINIADSSNSRILHLKLNEDVQPFNSTRTCVTVHLLFADHRLQKSGKACVLFEELEKEREFTSDVMLSLDINNSWCRYFRSNVSPSFEQFFRDNVSKLQELERNCWNTHRLKTTNLSLTLDVRKMNFWLTGAVAR